MTTQLPELLEQLREEQEPKLPPRLDAIKRATDAAEPPPELEPLAEQFKPGSVELARMYAEIYRGLYPNEQISPNEHDEIEPTTTGGYVLGEKRSRPSCPTPDRVVYRNKRTGRDEWREQHCNRLTCPQCREWKHWLEAEQVFRQMGEGPFWVAEIDDTELSKLNQRARRTETHYKGIPAPAVQRKVFSDEPLTDDAKPATIEDVVAALEARPLDRRNMSKSGSDWVSTDAIEAEWTGRTDDEFEVLGWWTRRNGGRELHQIAEAHDLDAEPIKEYGRIVGTSIGNTWESPGYVVFRRNVGFTWNEETKPMRLGGPPPRPDDPGYQAWANAQVKTSRYPFEKQEPMTADELAHYREELVLSERHRKSPDWESPPLESYSEWRESA